MLGVDVNWDAIGAMGETIAALAVVLSLLYLATQLRHSTREAQASNRNAMAQITTDLMLRIASDKELSIIFRKGQISIDELDIDETFRFDSLLYGIFESLEATFSHWQRGALADADWSKWETIIGMYMTQSGTQAFWKKSAANFSEPFRNYVNAIEPTPTYSFENVKLEIEDT